MLDGCTRSMAYGSSPMRPASTSALMSRSESNMARPYRGRQPLAAARDLQPMITNGNDRALAHSDHLAGLATRGHPVRRRHGRTIGGSTVNDVHPTGIHPDCQMRLGDRARLIGDLDQLCVLLARLWLRIAAQQYESIEGDPPPVIQQDRPILDIRGTRCHRCRIGEIRCCLLRHALMQWRGTRRRTIL